MDGPAAIILDWLRPLAARHPDFAISAELDLIESGIIDSIEILNLVCFIEERFELNVPIEAFTPENFRTARAIAELVQRTQTATGR